MSHRVYQYQRLPRLKSVCQQPKGSNRLPAISYRHAKGISGESRLQLLPKLVTIKHFDASNRLQDNVEYEHPFVGRQRYVPVTRTEATLRPRSCIKRRAEVVPAAAAVENHQF